MATTPQFTQSTLSGAGTGNWTSLQFGPDQRLYASKVDGTITAFTVETTSSGYQVAAGGVETINLIRSITNYNDDGTLAPAAVQGTRQVTGILVTSGTATAVAAATVGTPSLRAQDDAASSTLVGASDPIGLPPGLGDHPGQALVAAKPAELKTPAPIATSIMQRSPVGTLVTDVDASSTDGSPITYSLHPRGNGGGVFAIDPNTGAITVADPSKLNANVKGQDHYKLFVRVNDGGKHENVKVDIAVVEHVAKEPTGPIDTAVALAPTNTPVVLYVSSSDPRIGGGPDGGDVNLDTNSGVISRLTQRSDGGWDRIDIVRGLPRSEENHSVNGMQLSADGKTLYLAVGGNTNQGAPSNNFAYTPEYAYSAALLSIDLAAVDAMPTKTDQFGNSYKYNLPTLPAASADPYKTDPFGGQDGLSQAKIVTGGPVQIYSPGYRNPYDIVLTQGGKLYTIDNGANAGWGGLPTGEGTANVTNAPHDGGVDTADNLHLVTQGFYGGHPNPIRANPNGAGWYLNGSTTPVANLPQGWPPVSTANPVEGDYKFPNEDGSLHQWLASTNGLAEYTGSNFEGAMKGDLVAVSWDDQLYRIDLNAVGTAVAGVTKLTGGTSVLGGGLPLDVTAQGDGQTFAGTVWAANYGGGITVFTPGAAPTQTGFDADSDGLADNVDRFAEDPQNGKATDLAAGQSLVWNFSQNIDPPGPNALFNMGFTGLMSNNSNSYVDLFDPANIKAGGAAAGFQIEAVPEGDVINNTQQNGFQFGIDVQPDVKRFVIETKIDNPFGGTPSTTPTNYKNQGFYIGAGDQDNYLKIVAAANNGAGGIQVATENAGAASRKMYPAGIAGAGIQTLDTITLRLAVDVGTGVATPNWSYTVGGTVFNGTGAPVQLSGATLNALKGNYAVGGNPSALAVGIISTSYLSGDPYPAFWDSIKITADSNQPSAAAVAVNAGGAAFSAGNGTTYLADQYFSGGSTFNTTAAIANTTDDALYQNERYGSSFGYAIPVANGSYSVTLQFAENYFDAPGKRVFDVTAEGALKIDNLDIWSAAGNQKNAAHDVTVPVSVQDGILNLQFASSINNAKVDAIRVVPASGGTPAGVTVTQTGGSTAVTEGGATDTVSVALTSQPTSNVTVTVNGNADVGVASGTGTSSGSTTLSFTSANWNVAQTVTVAAVNDTTAEGPESANLTFATSSTDTRYNALSITPVPVAITDNDQAPAQGAQAQLSVTSSGALNASTYSAGSFKLENLSTAGQEMTTVTIDLSGSILAGMVFDPTGAAGDTTAKPFTVDGKVGTFTVSGATFGNGSDSAGYKTLSLQLQGFDPGETLNFSVDVDPTSIKGAAAPGPGEAGSVAGVELTGATATFGFGTTTLTNELFKVPSSIGGGTVLASAGLPAEPTITVSGVSGTTATVSNAQQTISVSGPAGATARVLVMEGGAFTAGVPATAPQLGPYEANSAVAVKTYDVVLNGQGQGQVAVTLTGSVPAGGLNFITASVLGTGGATGPASAPVALKLVVDTDGDGLLDTVDRFALDATNGGSNNLGQLGSVLLDFSTGTTPFTTGFTGVMANGQPYTALAASGSVANGKLNVQTSAGDPYSSTNTQQNAYQFGVDTSGVQTFTVETKVDNPFLGGVAAQNYRSAGLQIGAGDQDNYAKVVFDANNGAGGIQFLTELGGTPSGTRTGLGVPLQNVSYAMLYLDVAKTASGATATPHWTLHNSSGTQIGAGSSGAKTLTGALLDAVQGDLMVGGQQSELAVGVISTSTGSSGPIQAAWDHLKISAGSSPPPAAAAVAQGDSSTAVIAGTSRAPATSTVVDGTSALTGILSAQSGGALDVSGIDWSGAASLATETNDANGALAAQGTLDPAAGTSAGSSAYDFLVDPPIGFTRFDLTAAPYPNTASSTGDHSDFSLQRVPHKFHDFVL